LDEEMPSGWQETYASYLKVSFLEQMGEENQGEPDNPHSHGKEL